MRLCACLCARQGGNTAGKVSGGLKEWSRKGWAGFKDARFIHLVFAEEKWFDSVWKKENNSSFLSGPHDCSPACPCPGRKSPWNSFNFVHSAALTGQASGNKSNLVPWGNFHSASPLNHRSSSPDFLPQAGFGHRNYGNNVGTSRHLATAETAILRLYRARSDRTTWVRTSWEV